MVKLMRRQVPWCDPGGLSGASGLALEARVVAAPSPSKLVVNGVEAMAGTPVLVTRADAGWINA
jgi:hypothetical protein